MKGVNFITDDKNRKAVVIQLETIEEHQEDIEDFLDVIIAESRKDQPKRSWEEVKKHSKRRVNCKMYQIIISGSAERYGQAAKYCFEKSGCSNRYAF